MFLVLIHTIMLSTLFASTVANTDDPPPCESMDRLYECTDAIEDGGEPCQRWRQAWICQKAAGCSQEYIDMNKLSFEQVNYVVCGASRLSPLLRLAALIGLLLILDLLNTQD